MEHVRNAESQAPSWTPKPESALQQDSQRSEGVSMWEDYLALLVEVLLNPHSRP